MKSRWLIVPLMLAVASCNKSSDTRNAQAEATQDGAGAGDGRPPMVASSVAPGVAFDFRYAFALPERQIANVQEAHAGLCGRLGISHCRVTGLNFEKARDGQVRAATHFLVDPALALGFGRDATAIAERAEGKLASSEVTGEDAGKTIVASDKTADGIRAELAKLEAQLRIPGLSRSSRGELASKSGALRARLREVAGERGAAVDSLATTPVAFDYEVAPAGFGFEDPVRRGAAAGVDSLSTLVALLALTIGAIGPWAIIVGLGVWGWRLMIRRRAAG